LLRDYEILYIVRPELDDEQLQQAVASVDRLIDNLGGARLKTDVWGRRRLAYEVKHLREGQYVLTDFQIEPARVPEMEATLKISDAVFRHLIVRKPDAKRPAAAAAPAAAAKAQSDATGVDGAARTDAAPAGSEESEPAEPVGASAGDEEGVE